MNQKQFEAWWPEVSGRLNATLLRRGVRPADAADIVQETAVRTLAHWPDVDDSEGLARWAYTVAWRQCIDAHRRSRGAVTVSFDSAGDQPNGWDSERVVEGKLDLERTFKAMASLSRTDQAALVAAIDGGAATPADRKQAVREAVRLHRARLRLVGMVAKLGAALGVSWKALRKLVQLEASRAAGAAVAAVVLLGALVLPYNLDGMQLLPADAEPTEAAVLPPAPDGPVPVKPTGVISLPMPAAAPAPGAPTPGSTTTTTGRIVIPTTSTTIIQSQGILATPIGNYGSKESVEYPPDVVSDCSPGEGYRVSAQPAHCRVFGTL